MKRFGSLIFAAVLGSAMTIGVFQLLNSSDSKEIKIQHLSSTPVVGAAYKVNSEGEIGTLHFSDVAKDVMPAVVHIKTTKLSRSKRYYNPFRDLFDEDLFFSPQQKKERRQGSVSVGSGVIINSDGYIVTNNHVIDNSDDIEVALNDNKIFKAKIVGVDNSTDLALLKIDAKDLPSIPLVDSDKLEVGEWVLAVGNPFNLNSTVTAGIVSAKARNINILNDKRAIESFIQTDAAINPGNSGGALVNLQGGLVGINTAIASPTGAYTGYGFAIPSNIVNKVISDLMVYGRVQRGYLGLVIRNVDGNLAQEKDLDVTEGVYIEDVDASGAAAESGIRKGDVIKSINDTKVKTTASLLEVVGLHRPGDKVKLLVDRNGRSKEYYITLRNNSGTTKLLDKNSTKLLDVLGIEITNLDKNTARKLGIKGGVMVDKIFDGKVRNSTDMREGFIITKINNTKVSSVNDFVKNLENVRGGVLIEGMYKNYSGLYYYAFGL